MPRALPLRLARALWTGLWPPGLALLLSLGAGALIVAAIGESPAAVLPLLFRQGLGSVDGFARLLFDATPLILVGLSVAWAFRAGLFNIGAEGQLYIGAFCAAGLALALPGLPRWLALPAAVAAAALGGALWGALPGWLRARFGVHEVINTIMLNFIAIGLTGYLVERHLKEPGQMIPHTPTIAPAYHLHPFADGAPGRALGLSPANPLGPSLLIALAAAALVWALLRWSVLGFRLRAVGQGPEAARQAGIDVGRVTIGAMAASGALAGLVGVHEVLLYRHRFLDNFSAGLGFLGIAVALMGRSHPGGILLAALLFALLGMGALEIDIFTAVPRELVMVLQALIILAVVSIGELAARRRRRRRGAA